MKKIIFLPLFLIFLTGCVAKKDSQTQPNGGNMNLNNKKVLMVIAPKDFRDAEYIEPRDIFEKNGVEVKVASIQSGIAIGAEGTKVKIDLTVSEVNVNDFDAVAFIGGPGMAEITGDESLQVLAKKFYNAGKLTTAICVAPAILARAGVLQGKNATAWSGSKEDLKAGGAIYIAEAVVQDGKIITADGPASARQFGEKIVEALR